MARVCDNCGEVLHAENDSRCAILALCKDCYEDAETFIVRPKEFSVKAVTSSKGGAD